MTPLESRLQAKVLANTALEAAETDHAKAQSLILLARASHSAGAAQEAFRYYSQVRIRV